MLSKVLVVDDESVTRRVVVHALKAISVEVFDAADGSQALALASEHAFSLALVDINLPDIDGFGLIRALQEIPHMQNVPMVVFTARSDPGDDQQARQVGAAGFLYKPFSTQELRELVMAHLS